jgi:hypothetical protein
MYIVIILSSIIVYLIVGRVFANLIVEDTIDEWETSGMKAWFTVFFPFCLAWVFIVWISDLIANK